MSWSVLQSALSPSGTSTRNTATATFGSNATSGSTLIAAVAIGNSSGCTVTSVKDAALNSFVKIAAISGTNTFYTDVELWALNTPSGDAGIKPAITVDISATTGLSVLVQEVAGIITGATQAALTDGTPGTHFGTVASGAQTITAASYSSAASAEYLVSVYGDQGPSPSEALVTPSGYTLDANSYFGGGVFAEIAIAYQSSTGGAEAGSYTATSGQGTPYGSVVVAFKLAAGTTANAGLAAGTGTAQSPVANVIPSAGLAAGTGTAQPPVAAIGAAAGLAAGTGAAQSPVAAVIPGAGLPAGTGTALQPSAAVTASAGLATGTSAALSPAVSIQPGAGLGAGTAAASAPTAGISTSPAAAGASGTAQSPAAQVGAVAGLASGTGAALQPGITVIAGAGLATGTATALNPASTGPVRPPVVFTYGEPYFEWAYGTPYFEWETGDPHFEWETGSPYTS